MRTPPIRPRWHRETYLHMPILPLVIQYLLSSLELTQVPGQLDIRTLTIALGKREILSDAELKLQYGTHYAVVGRNGVGKSSMYYILSYGYKR